MSTHSLTPTDRWGALATNADWGRAYLGLLFLLLAGYALLGKGFAYFGVAPLFVGEISLLLGVLALHRSGCGFAALVSLPSLLLFALFALFLYNVMVDYRLNGIEAVRDGIAIFYGVFAFVVIALLLEDPSRLSYTFERYGSFALIFSAIGVAMPHLTIQLLPYLPDFPGTEEPFISVRFGESSVHLAGVAIAFLVGLARPRPWAIVLLAISFFALMPSRGAMFAFMAAILAAAILSGRIARFIPGLLAALAVFAVAYAIDFNVQINAERSVGARQFLGNIQSVFGSSDYSNLDGTKEWRIAWWTEIVRYTFHGEYFWTGKGFGMSLAETDGFVVGLEHGGPVLRSPHNINLTILARAGVPGLALWALLLVSWFCWMLYNIITARLRGEERWAGVFIWVSCYVGAIFINASVDVALEGPMQGIWFWSLIGFGIGAAMIYRYLLVSQPDSPAPDPLNL